MMDQHGMIFVTRHCDGRRARIIGTRGPRACILNVLAFFNPFGPVVNGRRLRLFEWYN